MSSWRLLWALAALALLAGTTARAAPPATAGERASVDRFGVRVASDTILELFRYTALPGPPGAITERRLAVPIHQYTTLSVVDLDVPWQPDSVDVELASWGSLHPAEHGAAHRIDGDLSVAQVRHRYGPAFAQLGRQVRTGGAARFVRFDGVAAGVRAPFGLGAEGYGGLTVLPRWSARPGYHLLGSAVDTMVRTPDALPEPSREQHWLAGGRAYYALAGLGELGASFHEQQEDGELGRRALGFDLDATPHEMVDLTAFANVDLDALDLADLRTAVDVYPVESLSLAVEFQHTAPALFLSRQSVLSVFSTDTFDEVGGSASYRPWTELELGAGGYVDVFADGSTGMRVVSQAKVRPLPSDRLVIIAGYRRVGEPVSGYHGLRGAVGYRVVDPLRLSVESHLYLYDEPIRSGVREPVPDTRFSWVGAMNADYTFVRGWSTLLGGALSSTPYAALDARVLARLRVDLWWGEGS